MSDQYGYPHIPLSKLRELRELAKLKEINWNWYSIWLTLIRQEIDRLIVEDLQSQIRNARNYRGIEGYPCPLCEYENGVWIRNCSMHQQIEDLREELEKAKAIIDSYEKSIYIGETEWTGLSGKTWKVDLYQGEEDD